YGLTLLTTSRMSRTTSDSLSRFCWSHAASTRGWSVSRSAAAGPANTRLAATAKAESRARIRTSSRIILLDHNIPTPPGRIGAHRHRTSDEHFFAQRTSYLE